MFFMGVQRRMVLVVISLKINVVSPVFQSPGLAAPCRRPSVPAYIVCTYVMLNSVYNGCLIGVNGCPFITCLNFNLYLFRLTLES